MAASPPVADPIQAPSVGAALFASFLDPAAGQPPLPLENDVDAVEYVAIAQPAAGAQAGAATVLTAADLAAAAAQELRQMAPVALAATEPGTVATAFAEAASRDLLKRAMTGFDIFNMVKVDELMAANPGLHQLKAVGAAWAALEEDQRPYKDLATAIEKAYAPARALAIKEAAAAPAADFGGILGFFWKPRSERDLFCVAKWTELVSAHPGESVEDLLVRLDWESEAADVKQTFTEQAAAVAKFDGVPRIKPHRLYYRAMSDAVRDQNPARAASAPGAIIQMLAERWNDEKVAVTDTYKRYTARAEELQAECDPDVAAVAAEEVSDTCGRDMYSNAVRTQTETDFPQASQKRLLYCETLKWSVEDEATVKKFNQLADVTNVAVVSAARAVAMKKAVDWKEEAARVRVALKGDIDRRARERGEDDADE